MKKYNLGKNIADSVELKCLLISKGMIVADEVFERFGKDFRLSPNPVTCNSFQLSDGTNVQLTDTGFMLKYLSQILAWNKSELSRYYSELETPFSLEILNDRPALLYRGEPVDFVNLYRHTDFYEQKTASGLPFLGNAVLQGCDFVSFQCLWSCEYAAKGKPCEFCFSGAEFEALAKNGKPQPPPVPVDDFVEIAQYAVNNGDATSMQITGGSTFSGKAEHQYITDYLQALKDRNISLSGEILLYITPPKNMEYIDEYFALGADRIACSIEVWDKQRAEIITPGKIAFTSRERHLKALEYIAEKHGINKAFSNFIIGLESLETLKEGATRLAERNIIPSASVWMPMGRPVMGSMKAPDLEYFRRFKEMFAEIYDKYKLFPAGGCGLNVCVEKDIYMYSKDLEPKSFTVPSFRKPES